MLKWLLVACPPLHNSIEPRHLINKSHPCALWATGILLIVEYYIYHIIINTHVDDDVMAQNMACPVKTSTNDQTVALPHGVRPYWTRGHAPILVGSLFS